MGQTFPPTKSVYTYRLSYHNETCLSIPILYYDCSCRDVTVLQYSLIDFCQNENICNIKITNSPILNTLYYNVFYYVNNYFNLGCTGACIKLRQNNIK